jgi:magnesium chelatase family protein
MKSYAKVFSAQPWHLDGMMVTIEVDCSPGLYAFSVVGLADKSVDESRDRVTSAIKNSSFESPKSENRKTVVSLSPADMKKEGAYFDLPIALGYLLATKEISFDPSTVLIVGELGLDGDVRGVPGIIALVSRAKSDGFSGIIVPEKNKDEAGLIEGINIIPVATLRDAIRHLDTERKDHLKINPHKTEFKESDQPETAVCFSTIRGQESAKRGLEIAASGGHNVILSGPPGTGKTLLARATAGILPNLSHEDTLSVTSIHSIAGILDTPLITKPPFRAPHHTASYVSIIGGGATPKPGEVTLAHKGLLFLDEFPEFDKRVIESLRQPLEDRIVHISRAKGSAIFPAGFMLVASMNPCPCGNRGAKHKVCRCSPSDIARYERKLSGPMLDRIDIHLTVEHIEYEKLSEKAESGERSVDIKKRIAAAREKQFTRFGSHKTNSQMDAKEVLDLEIAPDARKILNDSATALRLSPRAYTRTIKLARTIADMSDSKTIETPHILEALQYRPKTQ